MCTGEVEMKVWMRLRLAGLIASAQRSMSLNAARASPQTTALLVRLAISCTAAKSPSDAIGKPASMMSTPIWSSSSATSSFSSWVMVAPGHCSPSRKVVSKMMTRSCSDFAGAVMMLDPSRRLRPSPGALGSVRSVPLSAQAQTPGRRSGDDKEQEPAENEGAAGQALSLPGDRADIAARRHHFALVMPGRRTRRPWLRSGSSGRAARFASRMQAGARTAVLTFNHLALGSPRPTSCLDRALGNDDGVAADGGGNQASGSDHRREADHAGPAHLITLLDCDRVLPIAQSRSEEPGERGGRRSGGRIFRDAQAGREHSRAKMVPGVGG